MNTTAAGKLAPLSRFEQLRLARDIIQTEGQALLSLATRLDGEFCRAVELIVSCPGSVIVSGMGKAGLVGQKIAATLASTGTRSHFLHPAEAVHGDLGRIHRDDLVLMLSQSGETEETVRLLPTLAEMEVPLIAITGKADSKLARFATVTLDLGPLKEACPLGLAPSTSTTAMLALGDALALVASRVRNFGPEDFARFHPGGSLGRKLAKVEDVMRPLDQCRIADDGKTVRQVLVEGGRPGRRTGAILLTNSSGKLTGIFTDSDLARLFERKCDQALDQPIRNVMTAAPLAVSLSSKLSDAVELLATRKISELPVLDSQGNPVGLIDITDVLGMLPRDAAELTEIPDEPSTDDEASKSSTSARTTLPFAPTN
jgi:arabinose-5-phosphate isomerase